jgi:hypothetical protein
MKMAMYAETCSVEQRKLNIRPSTIKMHADGNITSKLIYCAVSCCWNFGLTRSLPDAAAKWTKILLLPAKAGKL